MDSLAISVKLKASHVEGVPETTNGRVIPNQLRGQKTEAKGLRINRKAIDHCKLPNENIKRRSRGFVKNPCGPWPSHRIIGNPTCKGAFNHLLVQADAPQASETWRSTHKRSGLKPREKSNVEPAQNGGVSIHLTIIMLEQLQVPEI